jgi:hypothetical protein
VPNGKARRNMVKHLDGKELLTVTETEELVADVVLLRSTPFSYNREKGFCEKTINLLTWHASNPLHIGA